MSVWKKKKTEEKISSPINFVEGLLPSANLSVPGSWGTLGTLGTTQTVLGALRFDAPRPTPTSFHTIPERFFVPKSAPKSQRNNPRRRVRHNRSSPPLSNAGYEHTDSREVERARAAERAAHVCEVCNAAGHYEGDPECPAVQFLKHHAMLEAGPLSAEASAVAVAAGGCAACGQPGHVEGDDACIFGAYGEKARGGAVGAGQEGGREGGRERGIGASE